MALADTIYRLRMDAGITQEELAGMIDPPITQAAVAAWEAGKSKPRYKVLSQLSAIFNAPIGMLLDGQLPPGAIAPVPSTATVPVLSLGTVHAGAPRDAVEDRMVVQAPADVVARHPNAFFLEVVGSCMDRVYPEGCMVLVDPDMRERNGCAVVAEHDGETVLRRYHRFTSTLVLSADSYERYEDIVITGDMEVRKVGVVVWFQAKSDEC